MRMEAGLDTGDMIAKVVVPITDEDTGGSLFDKLADAGADLLIRTVPHILDGTAVYEKQPEESPTPYAGMITKQMGRIDFHKSATELERLVRGLNPWPSAYTFVNGKTLKIWKCKTKDDNQGAAPGTVLQAKAEDIQVLLSRNAVPLADMDPDFPV